MSALIRLIGRALVWLLNVGQDPDKRPWDLAGALYVPDDPGFIDASEWVE